jgi:hypothetical protein
MDAHLLRVSDDVKATMIANHIPFKNYKQKFSSDLQIQPAAFRELLDKIQQTINGDAQLPKLRPLDWQAVNGFAEYYYPRTVTELVFAIDGIISHEPLIA